MQTVSLTAKLAGTNLQSGSRLVPQMGITSSLNDWRTSSGDGVKLVRSLPVLDHHGSGII